MSEPKTTAEAWKAIAAIAAEQGGLLTPAQALEAGCSEPRWKRLVRLGRLRPIHRGLYEAAPAKSGLHRELHAALLLVGDGAVLSHRSAGRLYQLWGIDAYPMEVTVPVRRRVTAGRYVLHHSDVPEEDVATENGLRLTTVPRTLCDLAAVLDQDSLAVAFEHVRRTRPEQLDLLAKRLTAQQRPRKGTPALLALLDDSKRRPQRSMESPFEVLVWRRLPFFGIELPAPQVPFRSATGRRYFIDFGWEKRKIALEVDGFGYHSSRKAFEADAQKLSALAAAGWVVHRLTWERFVGALPAVIKELRDTLRAR